MGTDEDRSYSRDEERCCWNAEEWYSEADEGGGYGGRGCKLGGEKEVGESGMRSGRGRSWLGYDDDEGDGPPPNS